MVDDQPVSRLQGHGIPGVEVHQGPTASHDRGISGEAVAIFEYGVLADGVEEVSAVDMIAQSLHDDVEERVESAGVGMERGHARSLSHTDARKSQGACKF